MFYASTDDPGSKAVANFSRYLVILLFAGAILYYMAGMVNLLIKREVTIKARFLKKEIVVGRRGDTSTFYFKGEDGRDYRIAVRHGPAIGQIGKLNEGDEVGLLLYKGILWTQIAEIHNKDNVYKKRF